MILLNVFFKDDIFKSVGAILVLGGFIYAFIKFVYYLITLKETNRKNQKKAFDNTVAQLSSDIPSSQLSAAILLRRFLGIEMAKKYPYLEKETINVISSLAKTLPTSVFQKTLVDGFAYASDLSLYDLQKINLQDALINNKTRPVIMRKTDLFLADLSYANINNVQAQEIILYRAVLFCAKIKNSVFTKADFRGADLTNVSFTNCELQGANFKDAINVPKAIKDALDSDGVFQKEGKVDARHSSNDKTIFFSMPGTMSKEDELLTKDYKSLLQEMGYDVIYYKKDEYPRFGQFNRVRHDIMRSVGMIAFGLKQLKINKALYRPGTNNEEEWSEKWLSTPWNEIEVGMGLMQGMPILLVSDPKINDGVFDSGLSECFVANISTTDDSRKLEQNKAFENWLSKLQTSSIKKIYVASSWKNPYHPEVVNKLREQGYQVFDFRNPPDGKGGFFWRDVDPDWEQWTTKDYISHLDDEWSRYGFQRDFDAMREADVCVLVLPCGRSAHTEAGWMVGAGKKVIAYIPDKEDPELMYKMFDCVTDSIEGIITAL